MTDGITLLFFMLVGHALADFPLQGDFLANGKNRNTPLGKVYWVYCLPAHGLIHGGAVAYVTGNVYLGIAETVAHMAIDWLKCEGKIGMKADQALHIGCKLLWLLLIALGVH